jgi:hypothetical protein
VWATGNHGLAAVHDPTFDGEALLGYDAQGAPDNTVVVGWATRTYGSFPATIVNYACHPTTLG